MGCRIGIGGEKSKETRTHYGLVPEYNKKVLQLAKKSCTLNFNCEM